MSTRIYLGEPPQYIKEWIKKHHKQSQFDFLYKQVGGAEWREYTPTANDIQLVDGKATIMASDFKQMDDFADIREIMLPNKWNVGGENLDVTDIGNEAFVNCIGLTNVTIGNNVTSIGESAFEGCRSLAIVTIPDSVASIGWSAFVNCIGLTSVTIPNSVTSIGDYAFGNCSGLTNITIPDNVTNIGDSAFWGCSGLTRVEFKGRTLAQVKAIPDANGNLRYAWGLDESVIVPGIVEDVVLYTTAASPSAWLESAPEFDASAGVFGGFAEKADAVKVVIPSKVNGIDVTNIGHDAFYRCSALTNVTIGSNVTIIGVNAFGDCSNLANVTIPDGVTSIKASAFYRCSELTSVTIPDSVTSIEHYAFSSCSSLMSFTVEDGNINYKSVNGFLLSRDGKMLVAVPGGLTSVTIPDGVTSIGDYAFADCKLLTMMTIDSNVTSIGEYAFEYCTGLMSITIPDSVTSIEASTFYGCSKLTSVTIPDSVTSIKYRAFKYCSSLTSIEFEGNAPIVGWDVFTDVASGCKAVVSPTATGFPAAGETWNGLIVEVKS